MHSQIPNFPQFHYYLYRSCLNYEFNKDDNKTDNLNRDCLHLFVFTMGYMGPDPKYLISNKPLHI